MSALSRAWKAFMTPAPVVRSVFAGAQMGRLTGDFVASYVGPHLELRTELAILRGRARDLERNNCYARRFLNACAENVVGPRGIRLQSLAVLPNGDPDEATRTQIEQAWAAWGEACDASGRMSWLDFQQLGIRSVARDGEALVRHLDGHDNAFGYAVQQLDPDLLDEGYNRAVDPTTDAAIVMAIEVDRYNRPRTYWLYSSHPYDLIGRKRERQPIAAKDIEHLFRARRPGQVRGESWLAPALIPLKMLAGYTEAELVAARTSAAKMGWIVRKDGQDYTPVEGAPDQPLDAAPGVIGRLDPGEEFQQWDPTHPGGNFDPFTRAVLREAAAGLGMGYATLTGDQSQANYGSQRAAMLMERDRWRVDQQWLAGSLHRAVFKRWLKNAIMAGALPGLRIADFDRHCKHAWQPRGWTWIDPYKDAKAAQLQIDSGLTSRRRVMADEGIDVADVFAELQAEQALIADLGLKLIGPTAEPVIGPADPLLEEAA